MHQFLNWRWYKGLGGGPIVDLGSHQIDVYNWFLGTNPVAVSASGGTDYYEKATHEWYDGVMAIYEYNTKWGTVRAFYQTLTTNSNQGYFESFMGNEGTLIISEASSRGAAYPEDIKLPVFLLTLLLVEQKLTFIGVIRKLLFLLTFLCFVVLLLTGFLPKLICGRTITGYPLMIHATFAPIFAICIAVLAVLTAAQHSFDRSNWRIVLNICKPDDPAIEACEKCGCFVKKLCFWVVVTLSLPLIISVVLGMLPFFDVHAQELLINIHRYSAVVLTASVKAPLMFAPAITTVFVLGVFWKRGTKQAALSTFITGLFVGLPYFLIDLPHDVTASQVQVAIQAYRVPAGNIVEKWVVAPATGIQSLDSSGAIVREWKAIPISIRKALIDAKKAPKDKEPEQQWSAVPLRHIQTTVAVDQSMIKKLAPVPEADLQAARETGEIPKEWMVTNYERINHGLGIPFMMMGLILLSMCVVVYVVVTLLTPAPTAEELEEMGRQQPLKVIFSEKLKGLGDTRIVTIGLFVLVVVLYYFL